MHLPGTHDTCWGRKWQPTPVFLPRESHGQRSLVWAADNGGAQSQTRLKRLSSSSSVTRVTDNGSRFSDWIIDSWDAGAYLFHASISHPHLSFFLFMIDVLFIPPVNVILPSSKSKAHNLPIMGLRSAAHQIFPLPPLPTHGKIVFSGSLMIG